MNELERLSFHLHKAEQEVERLTVKNGYVRTPSFADLRNQKKRVFVGRKGSGKSAHRIGLARTGSLGADFVCEIPLSRLDPKAFFRAANDVFDLFGEVTRHKLLRNVWDFGVCFELMESIKSVPKLQRFAVQHHEAEFHVIRDYLEKLEKRLDAARDNLPGVSSGRMSTDGSSSPAATDVSVFSNAATLRILGHIFLADGHDAEQASNMFPTDAPFRKARAALSEIVNASGGIVVIIDDLDKWIEEVSYDEMLPLTASLLHFVSGDEETDFKPDRFFIKAFIPEDLFSRAQFRHADKVKAATHFLRWRFSDLTEFLARRIAVDLSSVTNATLKDDAVQHWTSQILDPAITKSGGITDYVGGRREPWRYLMLHTHYRPRDLCFFMDAIVTRAIAGGRRKLANEDFDAGIKVARDREALGIIAEYRHRIPYVERLVDALEHEKAAMSAAELRAILRRAVERGVIPNERDHANPTDAAVERSLAELYEVGVIGKFVVLDMNGRPIDGQGASAGSDQRRIRACFSYGQRSVKFHNDDEVVIHPTFWGRLEPRGRLPLILGVVEPDAHEMSF